MTEDSSVEDHYSSGTLLGRIRAGLRVLGAEPPLPPDILAPVDEFHIGGRAATEAFVASLHLNSGSRVLDLGCGLGGPARFIAQTTGAQVTGIDLTEEFIETGRALTEMTGQGDLVRLAVGSILNLPFEGGAFDAAMMIHVGMNISDKSRLAREAARVLRPGGRFGIYDVMRVGDQAPEFPVPWASHPDQSALAPPEAYRTALQQAGFDIVAETNRVNVAKAFFAKLATAQIAAEGPPPLGLHLLMGETTAIKVHNMVAAIEAGRIAPVEIIGERSS